MIRRPPTSTAAGPTGRPVTRIASKPNAISWQHQVRWALVFIGVFAAIIWMLWPIVSILLAAAAIAYLLDPIADKLEDRGYGRNTGIGIIFGGVTLLNTIFLLVMLPMIASQFMELSANARGYVDNLASLVKPATAFVESNFGHKVPVDFDE